MQNTKTGTTWAPDIRPEAIETFEETYTPEGGEEQTVTYKRVADHPFLSGIRDKLAFFTTHAGAVWFNKLAGRTVKDELESLNAKMPKISIVTCRVNTTANKTVQLQDALVDGSIPESYAIPVVVTHSSSNEVQENIFMDGGNWCIYSTVTQRVRIRFYVIDL